MEKRSKQTKNKRGPGQMKAIPSPEKKQPAAPARLETARPQNTESPSHDDQLKRKKPLTNQDEQAKITNAGSGSDLLIPE